MIVQPPEQRGKPGEAKAPERKISPTSLVLGQTLEVFSCSPSNRNQLAGCFKAQAHCLRLGRLAPLRLTFGGIQNPKPVLNSSAAEGSAIEYSTCLSRPAAAFPRRLSVPPWHLRSAAPYRPDRIRIGVLAQARVHYPCKWIL